MIHIQCKNCGTWDIAGPGHPAVRPIPGTERFELFDRNAFNHVHADGCAPDKAGGRPLHFTFMAGTVNVGAA